jgi:hypothetical protein
MRYRLTSTLSAVFAFMFAVSGNLSAQTAVTQKIGPVKPAPRTPEGKPDLSGVWGVPDRAPGINTTAREESAHLEKLYGRLQNGQPSRTPWAEEIFLYNDDPRKSKDGIDGDFGAREELNPMEHCVPYGPSLLILSGGAVSVGGYEIIQSARRILIIYEQDSTIRQIWMDGRGHPPAEELERTFMGHSIGRWEGDTLVVDTIGLRNEPWLDGRGNVSSSQLRMVERYQRLDNDSLKIELTLIDPIAFKEPWVRSGYRRLRNWDLAEDLRCWPGSEQLRNQQDVFYFRPER